MSIFVGFRSGSSWLLFICTVIIVQLTGKAIHFGTSFFSVCVCVCEKESIYVLEEYYGYILWVSVQMLIYNRHLLQEALYSNSTLSCFICFTTAIICAPYEKSDNRAPKWTPQPFRSAFICLLCALLGSFRSLVAMCHFKGLVSISLTPEYSVCDCIVLYCLHTDFLQ